MSDDTKNTDDAKPEGEESKAEETKAEETKAEETKAEETKAEEPKAEEKAEEPKAEEPKAEEKAEEPKAEEKAEEPKAEEPKAESPGEKLAAGDPGAKLREEKADEEKAEEPKAEETAEEPKAEEPAAEEPAAEAPAAEEPAAESYPVSEEPAAPAMVNLGTLIEFQTEESLMAACETVRDAGWTRWDAHTPYPVHGLDDKMGIKPTILPWIVFGGGLTGCLTGLILQFYTNGVELPFSISETLADPFLPSGYKFVTSGKPIFSVPANIPVTFELTILLSAFAAFFGMWGLNKMPQFWHPVFQSTRFRKATDDRFFISLEAEDPLYHPERAQAFAETLGGSYVEALMGEEE